MRKFLAAFLFAILFLFASCGRSEGYHPEADYAPVFAGMAESAEIPPEEPATPYAPKSYIPENAAPWQIAFAEILRGYKETNYDVQFLLHDIDHDGIPELFLLKDDDCENYSIAVYMYKNGDAILLQVDENVDVAYFFHADRHFVSSSCNAPGIVLLRNGLPMGNFMVTASWYWRLNIDGEKLTISDFGERRVDVDTLVEMFGQNGQYAETAGELWSARAEHTHFFLNGNALDEREFRQAFRQTFRLWERHPLTGIAIREEVFGSFAIRAVTRQINESMPYFTFYHTTKNRRWEGISDYWGDDFISITITDENGNIIQQIDEINVHLMVRNTVVQFDDFNFDGYLDMRLLQFNNGVSLSWNEHYHWLWDTEISQFVLSERLMEIANHAIINDIDPTAHQIVLIVDSKDAGAFRSYRRYQYYDGDFTAIAEFDVEYLGGRFKITRTDLLTNEVKITEEERYW